MNKEVIDTKIAQIICCLYPDECKNCKSCPDENWTDVIEQVNKIKVLYESLGYVQPKFFDVRDGTIPGGD